MSVAPGRQFFPAANFIDSFHFSLSKFHAHGISHSLSRYHPSSVTHFTRRKFSNCSTQNSICSNSTNKQNPTNRFIRNCVSDSSSSVWLDKWKEPNKGYLPKAPPLVLDHRASRKDNGLKLSGISSSGSGSTMDRIVEKLRKFGYMDDDDDDGGAGGGNGGRERERVIEKGSVEDILYVEEGMLPNTRGGFSKDSVVGLGRQYGDGEQVLFPWEEAAKRAEEGENSLKRKSRSFMAELTLPESELRRLKHLTLRTKQKLRIGGAGVTQAVVDEIHNRWKSAEIVRLKIEGAPALNMRRVHEILERKTGGLVIWRSGTSVSLYRGVSYEVPSEEMKKWTIKKKETQNNVQLLPDLSMRSPPVGVSHDSMHSQKETVRRTRVEKEDSYFSEVNYEDEMDKLLSDLGPRYTDWSEGDPLPVDADLLPTAVPGYQPPFRLLPYGVRRSLGPKEATDLRRIARTLPPHFALGRSRQLEGLASAIVNLWERSSIAKVALKRGVQLTTSERMAEDIKRLTGGILLSRNKDFLVFYRGKDFLSSDVTEALLERERLAKALQDKEEQARMEASASVLLETASASVATNAEANQPSRAAGTLHETLDANAKWGKRLDDHEREKMIREAELMRHANLVRKLEKKLAFAERKLMKAGRSLAKVEEFLKPADQQADPEGITDEERFMFRKLGLRMKAFLLLGRRGVFDGTVENMHLHWKYRELVKIIVKAKNFEDVKSIALSLEAESGGILVSVDKLSKGYAIIVYRGKDYERPPTLRPKNLLTKRKALARSIELQRQQALLKHIAQVQKNVEKLKSEIEQMDTMKDQKDSTFYDSLDASYPSEDEDYADECDEAYLEAYSDLSDEDDSERY